MQNEPSSPQHVLVTGSSGRVGSAVCAALKAAGLTARGLDRVAGPNTQVQSEIDDLPTLRQALRGIDAVVHCAALHAPHVGQYADAEFRRINVDATRQLAELSVAMGIGRFVFTSTTALYGRAAERPDRTAWIDIDTPAEPDTIYHHTKLDAEHVLLTLAESASISLSILRMSRCFPEPADQMAVHRLHRGVDVRDVAAAHAQALRQTIGVRRWLVSATPVFKREDLPRLFDEADRVIFERAPGLAQAFAVRGWPLPRHLDRVYDPGLGPMTAGWRPAHGWEAVLNALAEGRLTVLAASPNSGTRDA
ncbi:NAD(P)-dependent oxidoreductase [Ahniella affigens]|uniref:NAD(P)-dependent oxidoreductase n=1 Tax=Ahniella affigens TaxID=2021234 RepID=A0A2P1PZE0_9GAMM|nr:NAD(P)-dependent oxidoreductase [Ahniella affigens]AVQ00187.1 NAD(P)-dependent oxidoreductase [Ahniella affigens]